MRGDGHVGGAPLEREVVHAQVLLGLGLGRGAGGADARLEVLVNERAPGAVIELQVAAARGVKFRDHGAVRRADVLEQLVLVRVEAARALGRRLVTVKLEQELGGGGDGLLSRVPRLLERLNELEVLDEGVVFTGDLAGEDGRAVRGLLAHEEIAVVELHMLDPAESPHEVEVPVGAAELAVCEQRQAGGLLLGDKLGDAGVLDGDETCVVKFAGGVCGSGLLECLRAQEATDDVESGGCDGGHDRFLSVDAISDERSMRDAHPIGKYLKQSNIDRKNLWK